MATKYKPSSDFFGYEVGNDIDKIKSMQKQCISALVSNAKTVTLPAYVEGDTPIDTLLKTNTAIINTLIAESIAFSLPDFGEEVKEIGGQKVVVVKGAGAVATNPATLILVDDSISPVDCVTLIAKKEGNDGNNVQVKVEPGSISGVKVTLKYGSFTEVNDNLADVDAVISALATSTLVTAQKIADGDLLAIAYTNLLGGYDGVDSNLAINDGQIQKASVTAQSLFTALQTAGYLY